MTMSTGLRLDLPGVSGEIDEREYSAAEQLDDVGRNVRLSFRRIPIHRGYPDNVDPLRHLATQNGNEILVARHDDDLADALGIQCRDTFLERIVVGAVMIVDG